MKTYIKPTREQWEALTKRPTMNQEKLTKEVISIINDVKEFGNNALIKYARIFDGVELSNIRVSKQEIKRAEEQVSQELKEAIQIAYNNIYTFHKAQQKTEEVVETTPGVKCWRKSVAIEKVGLYIPGGSAPLFSTILMLGIPAQIAGCEKLILSTPPDKNQQINPAILYTAQ
ncbi:MAG: histidinol dehydrogenase, partial [Salinivirgaceae bacterium]|nr:histidinol dehydrogenase [Salinivirgaceae bacterium]